MKCQSFYHEMWLSSIICVHMYFILILFVFVFCFNFATHHDILTKCNCCCCQLCGCHVNMCACLCTPIVRCSLLCYDLILCFASFSLTYNGVACHICRYFFIAFKFVSIPQRSKKLVNIELYAFFLLKL